MPVRMPWSVPRRFSTEGPYYGVNGACEALRNAELADQWVAHYEDKIAKLVFPQSARRAAYEGCVRRYRKLGIEWRACALNTLRASRKRLQEEEAGRRELIRLEREYGLVCSPESIQRGLK